MIIDSFLEFSDSQALTASADSTNSIDLANAIPIGPGREIWVVIQVDVASDFTTGDETYSIAVETDDNSSFSSAETLATLTLVGAQPAGTRLVFGFTYTNQRYLQLSYTLAGTTPSVTLSAWLSMDMASAYQALPKATNS